MQRMLFTVDPAIFELGIPARDLLRDATDNASVHGTVESSTTREYGSAKVDAL